MFPRIYIFAALLLCSAPAVSAQETTYTPRGGVRPSTGRVEIESVRLLAQQDLFDRNISVEKLAAFTHAMQQSVTRAVGRRPEVLDLRVRVTVSPKAAPKFDIASQGDAPEELLQRIYDDLQKVPPVRSTADPLPFEVYFRVKAKP
jgi:hypothetical protein